MKKRIHVNQHNIKKNARTGEGLPVITIKTYSQNIRAHQAKVHGESIIVYSPDNPLPCGAKVWIETDSEVTAITTLDSATQEITIR